MAVPGGHVAPAQRAGTTIGSGAIFSADGELTSGVRSTSQPSNPTGAASTTATMMGLGGSVMPNAGGNVLILITGDILNATIGDGVTIQISHGTGTAPTNAAALTGTQDGVAVNFIASTAAGKVPFCVMAYVTGLTVGVSYWIDLASAQLTGGAVTMQHINIVAIEI
jgi:hypothetical protein